MTTVEILGDVEDALLDTPIVIASNNTAKDAKHNWQNLSTTVRGLIQGLSTFEVGEKDGRCILQGQLVDGRRLAKNVIRNHLLMVDIDTGMSVDRVIEEVQKAGHFAVIWTTYSHLTTVSEISETKLTQWCTRNGTTLGYDNAEIEQQAREYFQTEKRYDAAILDGGITFTGRVLKNGGVVYMFAHTPIPKVRALFVLRDPFEFAEGGTQAEKIALWKDRYAAISDTMGLPYDNSCVDPSRLMFTPRVPSQEALAQARFVIVAGDKLNLDAVGPAGVAGGVPAALAAVAATFQNAAGGPVRAHGEFATPGLLKLVAECPDLDVASWLRSVAPEDERNGGPATGGIHWTCPNEDGHTKVSDDDTAFAVFEGESWGMSCRHETCINASRNDRIWFLDRLCQKYGIADARELRQFSDMAMRSDKVDQQVRAAAASPEALTTLVASVTPETPEAELQPILAAIGSAGPVTLARHAKTLSATLGFSAAKVEKLAKEAAAATAKRRADKDREDAAEDGVEMARHPVPADLATAPCIWTDWPADVQVSAVIERLHHVNSRKPFLFRREEGGIVRVTETVSGRMTAEAVQSDQWAAILNDHVTFKAEDPMTQAVNVVPTPRHIVPILKGTDRWKFPELRSISRVPLFSPEGNLRIERGYDEALKVYLDPTLKPLPVSAVPTEAEVQEALELLREPLIDFPFSDYDDAELPIHDPVLKDPEGHPVPNPDRGRASKTNMLAMILQPFARNLIDGPTPAFHIDKPDAGTGAGFIADVVYCIAEGRRAEIQTMSAANEEFRKAITATLRSGASIIFVDNIGRTVDSTDLAAALTSGVWRDRILGKTETVTIPVTAMWMLAGNEVRLTAELKRRMVPVNLDAGMPNPALNRPINSFKYGDLQGWCLEYREELVWACHTLIANWFAKGKPAGSAGINSFNSWSRVMSGILEAAGVKHFLDNIPVYLSRQGEDGELKTVVATALFARYGTQRFTAAEALATLTTPMMGEAPEVPWREDDTRKFGAWLGTAFARGTVDVPASTSVPSGTEAPEPLTLSDGSEVYRVRIEKTTARGLSRYRLTPAKMNKSSEKALKSA